MTADLKIGGASGFWGESPHATAQLLQVDGLDVLVYDYLAEITMSIMARARLKSPEAGFAGDFVTQAMGPNLNAIAEKGVTVLSNAGGVNPQACGDALRARIDKAGLALKVAVVEGDDLLPRAQEFAACSEMFSGAVMPPRDKIASMNAYIGAAPIVAALQSGADIVITGRCVDSALTLAACVHHFGWSFDEYDRLAAGSLAGHLLECGPQSTGGNFTDWEQAGDLAAIGYPVAEVSGDGGMVMTKPGGTSGAVNVASVCEQMLYEIGDPRAYLLPDVICDFAGVEMQTVGPDRVRVTGARGRAPSGSLKVSTTWADGYRGGMVFQFNGRDARRKATAFAQAGLDRAQVRLDKIRAPAYREVSFEAFGGRPDHRDYEEITFKAAVRHDDARAIGVFLKELIGTALATPPGLHFFTGAGRPKPSPVVALFSFLVEADKLTYRITLDGAEIGYDPARVPVGDPASLPPVAPDRPDPVQDLVDRRLEDLAWARSGDKGNSANIGVIARHPAYLPWIWAALSPEAVRAAFADEAEGEIERFYLPGTASMNLLLHEALGGGGIASLRNDAQAKAFAQRLLSHPIKVPAGLIMNTGQGADQTEEV